MRFGCGGPIVLANRQEVIGDLSVEVWGRRWCSAVPAQAAGPNDGDEHDHQAVDAGRSARTAYARGAANPNGSTTLRADVLQLCGHAVGLVRVANVCARFLPCSVRR